MLQLSNTQKFSANTWHLPQKIINLGELQGISKLPIRFSASADDRNTFSFVCVSCACGGSTRKCFALAFMSGLCITLNCSSICDVFDQKTINISRVFNVFMFIILLFESNFFFLIDYLDSFPKLYCYTIRSFRCYPYQFYGYPFGCECDNSRDA